MKYFSFFILILIASSSMAQSNDLSRIVLNPYISQSLSLPSEAKSQLENKLSQIASNYGMSGNQYNARFVITANANIASKDIVAGPPNLIALNIDLTLYIGDGIDNILFTSVNIPLKGVGTNENKALIDAFRRVSTKNSEIERFITNGNAKIVDYYSSKCDFILANAASLVKQGKHDEAIYNLSMVPEVIKDCFLKSKEKLNIYYKEKIDLDCVQKLNRAKAIWASSQSQTGAVEASDILFLINPTSSCAGQVNDLVSQMRLKIESNQREAWEFKLRQYADQVKREDQLIQYAREDAAKEYELDKIRSENFAKVAIQFAKNQPKTVNYTSYNRINWW